MIVCGTAIEYWQELDVPGNFLTDIFIYFDLGCICTPQGIQ